MEILLPLLWVGAVLALHMVMHTSPPSPRELASERRQTAQERHQQRQATVRGYRNDILLWAAVCALVLLVWSIS